MIIFKKYVGYVNGFLYSKQSDERIDFTMLCVCVCVCVCVYIISCRSNGSIINFSTFSGWRVNLVSSWCIGWSIFEILSSFQKQREKPKKN